MRLAGRWKPGATRASAAVQALLGPSCAGPAASSFGGAGAWCREVSLGPEVGERGMLSGKAGGGHVVSVAER